jgi:archaellum component FlaF (FlaF/FlaG flagellin family)
MGFSVGLASFIVLIGFVALFSTVCTAFLTNMQDISYATSVYISNQQDKLNTQIQLTVDSITSTRSEITIKNIGSKTIFLQNSNGYNWNTIILSYGSSAQRYAYSIESYSIEEIKVIGTNSSFNIATHKYINPGEQATISLNLPSGAPEISASDVVSVTFASYYGATASSEGMMA